MATCGKDQPRAGAVGADRATGSGYWLALPVFTALSLCKGPKGPSQAEADGRGVAGLEVAIARHGPDREEFRIAMIAKVKNAGEPHGREARLVPQAVSSLRPRQVVDAARHRGMIDLASGHQAEHCPGGLRG